MNKLLENMTEELSKFTGRKDITYEIKGGGVRWNSKGYGPILWLTMYETNNGVKYLLEYCGTMSFRPLWRRGSESKHQRRETSVFFSSTKINKS
ncbi:MAG: hypothetical protein ACOC2U_01725 [bacterium]